MADRNQPLISDATRLFFQVADPEGLGKAVAKPKGRKSPISIGRGVLYDPETGQSWVPDVYQESEARYQERMLERLNAAAEQRMRQFGLTQEARQQERARAPEKIFQESQDAIRLAGKADQVAAQLQDMMNRGEGPKSFAGETAMEWAGPAMGGAVRKGIEKMAFSEPERNLRAAMADLSTAIDQAKMKGVLSDQDLQRLQAASFNEPGISDSEALARLKMAADILRESSQSAMAGRPPPAGVRPQPNLSGDTAGSGPAAVRATQAPATPSATPAPPPGVDAETWRKYLILEGMQ